MFVEVTTICYSVLFMNFSIPHFHRFLSDFFVAVGFAILIFFLPGAIGILLSFIFLAIATFIIYSNLKYSTRISYYDPLLLSVAMVAAMGSILFVEHLPTKAYPIIGCLLLSPMINMCAWAIDKRYKEQSFKHSPCSASLQRRCG